MATTRKAAAKTAASAELKPAPETRDDPRAPDDKEATEGADQGIVRGGSDVGYRGTRVDDTPDEAYSVTGVLRAAGSE